MQKIITADSRNSFEKAVNEALKHGWRVVPGTTYAACGQYELSEEHGRDYGKRTAPLWFFSIVVERDEVEGAEQ